MIPLRFFFLSFFACFFLCGCREAPCKSSNPVFYENVPGSQVYRRELARELERHATTDLQFTINHYFEKDGHRFLMTDVRGKELCAKMILRIDSAHSGIDDVLLKKGLGYQGAELEGLHFETAYTAGGVEFIFRDVEDVVD